jgi:tRNA1Val (adenine37-N6)-methyltransferase
MTTKPFHLKPFSLFHHRSAMKVGMDGLLLGGWVNPILAKSILDVGTGCGILALMLASKSRASIDAIELDQSSAEEAALNFQNSIFSKRLKVYNEDFVSFSKDCQKKYDLIISNPPFFSGDHKPATRQRLQARHTENLSYEQLAKGSAGILNQDGLLYLVLPYNESKLFLEVIKTYDLHLQRQLFIFPIRGRINLAIGKTPTENIVTDHFVIRDEDYTFSRQYCEFFKDWLLGIN